MARNSAVVRNEVVRRPRARLQATLRVLKGGCGPGCDVTVVYADAAVRFEVHRETKANGRSGWFAVAVYAGEVHDVRRASRR